MDKTESNDQLLSRPNGTFLLRYSDGTVGGITIAWVADQQDKPGMMTVMMVVNPCFSAIFVYLEMSF